MEERALKTENETRAVTTEETFESRKKSALADLTDLDARKREVLDGLEARALKTEKDYQREIDDWADQVEDRLEKAKDSEKIAASYRDEAKADAKYMEKIYKEGKAKGFNLKIKTFKF